MSSCRSRIICLTSICDISGDIAGAENQEFKSVFEVNKVRPLDKRKRKRNDDSSDIEGYLGPWAKYQDEETVSKPEGEDAEYLEEYLSKMNRRGKKQQEDKPIEEKSQLHIKDAYDYQNRSFLHIPQDVGITLKGVLNCQLTPHFQLIFAQNTGLKYHFNKYYLRL